MAPASASDTPLFAEAKTNYEVITAHWVARDCEIETKHLEHLAKEAEKAAQKAEQEAQKAAQKAVELGFKEAYLVKEKQGDGILRRVID